MENPYGISALQRIREFNLTEFIDIFILSSFVFITRPWTKRGRRSHKWA